MATRTMYQEMTRPALPARGFRREGLETLSGSRDEPAWMLERRYQGWVQFQEMDPPDWPRTDISKLDWDRLIPFAPPQTPVPGLAALPPKLRQALSIYGRRAGLLIQRDSAPIYLDLADELRAQGVVWTDMNTALHEHPELVRDRFMQEAVSINSDKVTALHAAFWSGGTFLYVPPGLKVELPFVSVLWQEMPELAVFPHTLLVVDDGADVIVVSELLSMGCEACPDSYLGGVSELYLGANARVRFVTAQDLGRHVYDLRRQTALLGRDSNLEWLSVTLGGRLSRASQHTILREPGGEARVTGLYLPDGKQHMAMETLQDHVAPHCQSDLLYQGALLGASRSVYEGTIRVWPGAQKTDAYQSNRNLLLSKRARADSLPQLEIEANDLRCTHGATVGQVDEDHVFYLMSRGIPRFDAVRLIVEGFFQPSLDRMPEPLYGLRDRLTGAIAAKLRG